jgi:hypothetical protein
MGRFNDMGVRASERFKHVGFVFRSEDGTEQVFLGSSNEEVDSWLIETFSDPQEVLKRAHRVTCEMYDELWIIAPETVLVPPK